jgi:hypothetical protein
MNHRDDAICDKCRLKLDDYLVEKFPSIGLMFYRPSDAIYNELDSIRLSIAKRKVEALYQ